MKHTLLYIVCLAVALMAGCKPSTERAKLLYAESIMNEKYDSALILLNEMSLESLQSDADRALYAMLRTEALDKNHQPLGTDSLIGTAVEHFTRVGDDERTLISTYYQGRTQYLNEDYPSAIVSFLQARELGKKLGENFWVGLSCRGIADTYNRTFNTADELVYTKEAYQYMLLSKRQPYIDYALLNLSRAYCSNYKYDSLMVLTNQVKDSAIAHKDLYLLCAAKNLEGISYIGRHMYKEAISTFEMICSQNMATTDDSAYLSLAYMEEGNVARAKETAPSPSHSDAAKQSYTNYRNFKILGKTADALRELEVYDSISNTIFREHISQSLNNPIIKFHDLTEQKNRAELQASNLKMWLSIILGIIAISLVLWISYYLISKQRKEIAENSSVIDLQTAKIRENASTISDLSRQLKENATNAEHNRQKLEQTILQMEQTTKTLKQELHTLTAAQRHESLQKESAIIRLRKMAEAQREHPDSKLWHEVCSLVENYYPQMLTIKKLPTVNDKDYRFCILVKLGLEIRDIIFLEKTYSGYVSNTRIRLLKKVFNKEGGAKEFDHLMSEL